MKPWGAVAVLAGMASFAISSSSATAAVGDFDYVGCITGKNEAGPTPGSGACTRLPNATAGGGNSGQDALSWVVVSPDGRNLYGIARSDDAIVTFERSTSHGALAYEGCISGESEAGSCTLIPSATSGGDNSGLNDPTGLTISPDGSYLYAAVEGDNAVARFDRDPDTGQLDFAGCITGETNAPVCTQIPSTANGGDNSGLDGLTAVTLSPDGRSLYAVARLDSAVARFDRDPGTGQLDYVGCISGETESSSCTQIPAAATGGFFSGLSGAASVAVSPDGTSLYAAAGNDSAVAYFNRDPDTGALTYSDCISGAIEAGPTPAGTGACELVTGATSFAVGSGVETIRALAVSPDSRSVYTASFFDDAVARFNRDPDTGALTYGGCISGNSGNTTCTVPFPSNSNGTFTGLNELSSITAAPDGRALYVTSEETDAVTRIQRTLGTGEISYTGTDCVTGELGGFCDELIPRHTMTGGDSGLGFAASVTLSPDGRSLYAASRNDDAVARFRREADTTAPVAEITKAPKKKTAKRKAKFEFEAPEPDLASFECSLDGAAFAECESPFVVQDLKNGKHRFEVRAEDWGGNTGPTDKHGWKVKG